MKVFIKSAGDPSVGIPSGKITIDLGNCAYLAATGEAQNDRELTRTALIETFGLLLDEPGVGVLFEDECADCGKQGCGGECCDDRPEMTLEQVMRHTNADLTAHYAQQWEPEEYDGNGGGL